MSRPDAHPTAGQAAAAASIAHTKLAPPRGPRHPVPRPALLERLTAARRRRCMAVLGPAGSGKTQLLVAWRKELLALDFDVAWLTLTPGDDSVRRFVECIAESLAEVDPSAVREAQALLAHDSGSDALETVVLALAQGFSSRDRDLVLVIDDLHVLQDPRAGTVLQWLLDYAPKALHLAISSRSALPVSLAPLRAQGEAAEFDLRDLRFTPDETAQFLRTQLGEDGARLASALHEATGGWIAGLQLFALDLKQRRRGAFTPMQLRDARAFSQYFEREVLECLAPDDLELLGILALCNRFCAPLAAALQGRHGEAAESGMARRLARLEHDNLFVARLESGPDVVWYRLHPLLREVLLQRLQALPPQRLAALHGAASHWFDAHGSVDEAVRHAVEAGDPVAAAAAVQAAGERMLARAQYGPLASLMRRLPPEQIRQRFGLRVYEGFMHLAGHDMDAARRSVESLWPERLEQAVTDRGALGVLAGTLAVYRDDVPALAQAVDELHALGDAPGEFTRATRRNLSAWLHLLRHEYAQVRTALVDGEDAVSPRNVLMSRCLVGMSQLLEGRIADAEQAFREVLEDIPAASGVELTGVQLMARGLLAEVLYERNEVSAALQLLAVQDELLEHAALPDTVMRTRMLLAAGNRLSGRRLEAWEHLDQLEDYANRQGLPRLRASALQLRIRWYAQEGALTAAQQALQRLEALGQAPGDSAGPMTGASFDVQFALDLARSALAQAMGDVAVALARLQGALQRCQDYGKQRGVPMLRMRMAALLQEQGQDDTCMEQVALSLALGQRQRLTRSLLDATGRTPALLGRWLASGEAAASLLMRHHAERLLTASASALFGASEGTHATSEGVAAEPLSDREAEVVHLLGQAMPNKRIARVLGVSPETVKWHLKKVYTKLGVSSRDAAVARLRDLQSAAGGSNPQT